MISGIKKSIKLSFRNDYLRFYLTQIFFIVSVVCVSIVLGDVPIWFFGAMFLPSYAVMGASIINYVFNVNRTTNDKKI